MRGSSQRAAASLWVTCLLLAVVIVALGFVAVMGAAGVRETDAAVSGHELMSVQLTSQLGQQADLAVLQKQAVLLSPSAAERTRLAGELYGTTIPAVDVALSDLMRLRAGEPAAERAGLEELAGQWTVLRRLLLPAAESTTATPASTGQQLLTAFAPLQAHVSALTSTQTTAAAASERKASRIATGTRAIDLGVLALGLATAGGCAWFGGRRIRRAMEPARDQIEFADTLQLAEDEDEAHQLLQRHLQRAVVGSAVTVLNRNNSADRLEAKTALPVDSPLVATLRHAEPKSCLAVRSGRSHDGAEQHPSLLACPVCATCPGFSTCAPLTVGGEVIGAVLVQRPLRYLGGDQQRIRDSVGQAAPVLANLRNLAIAELRAATDGLTGLPNKRAVTEGLKLMVAQASRTLTPMALLMLDLDHFKKLNDTFGHPAGDQALSGVGVALRSVLRASDFAGRNGGEEFAVILPDTDAAGAAIVGEAIRAAIAAIALPDTGATVTASVGIAGYPEHATTAESLERLADSALYVAKRGGRNRIEVASPSDRGLQTVVDRTGSLAAVDGDQSTAL